MTNKSERRKITKFSDIPDVLTMEVPALESIVPALGIARNTIVLWTGADGDGKTFLVQAMAVATARGTEFLGMPCRKTPVLYLDFENAAFMVQDRLRSMIQGETISDLRVWGIWNEEQPPMVGNDLLLTMAKGARPLIIVDPFRYFHRADENDSTAMTAVMRYLRACSSHGSAVVLLHHPSKAEGSTGRGSSAIRGACDLAFIHTLDKETGLITLKVDKNRHGESRTLTIRANFEDGQFEVTNSPYITRRKDELDKIAKVIEAHPGITQNGIAKESRIHRNRLPRLLDEGRETLWHSLPGPNRATFYYLCPSDGFGGKALGILSASGKA